MTLRDTHTSTLSHTHTVREREREECVAETAIYVAATAARCVTWRISLSTLRLRFHSQFSSRRSFRYGSVNLLGPSTVPLHHPLCPPLPHHPPCSLPSYFINLLKGPTKNSLATFAARNGKVNKHERKGGGPREGGEGRGHGEIERKRNE